MRSGSLRARLQTLRADVGRAPSTAIQPPTPASKQRRLSIAGLANLVNGTEVAEGLIERRVHYPLSDTVGNHPIGHKLLSTLNAERDTDHCSVAILDTETTGLSGGVGTMAFLVGVVVCRADAITLVQLLLARMGAESELLRRVNLLLENSTAIVTYNGKSFDVPLLSSRMNLHRIASPFSRLAHFDLVHPIRAAFNDSWDDCRLQTVERNLLAITRHDDLGGALIPQVWRDWLTLGRPNELVRVLEHNEQDLLSLTVLPSKLDEAVKAPAKHGASVAATPAACSLSSRAIKIRICILPW
ncbi:MAG: ribonuclease H-like domain-containing protein [Gammaproteobacteria bacterium]|nr:ribonuclease H-like domain-containing protein [Gammaproteobacteria bacterium]